MNIPRNINYIFLLTLSFIHTTDNDIQCNSLKHSNNTETGTVPLYEFIPLLKDLYSYLKKQEELNAYKLSEKIQSNIYNKFTLSDLLLFEPMKELILEPEEVSILNDTGIRENIQYYMNYSLMKFYDIYKDIWKKYRVEFNKNPDKQSEATEDFRKELTNEFLRMNKSIYHFNSLDYQLFYKEHIKNNLTVSHSTLLDLFEEGIEDHKETNRFLRNHKIVKILEVKFKNHEQTYLFIDINISEVVPYKFNDSYRGKADDLLFNELKQLKSAIESTMVNTESLLKKLGFDNNAVVIYLFPNLNQFILKCFSKIKEFWSQIEEIDSFDSITEFDDDLRVNYSYFYTNEIESLFKDIVNAYMEILQRFSEDNIKLVQ